MDKNIKNLVEYITGVILFLYGIYVLFIVQITLFGFTIEINLFLELIKLLAQSTDEQIIKDINSALHIISTLLGVGILANRIISKINENQNS